MVRFNSTISRKPNATTYEGGAAYEKNAVQEWMNFLFSSYLEDKYYESAGKQLSRFTQLTEDMIAEYGPEFVGKAAFFARNELGMRSVSQLVAAMLNTQFFDTKRRFYSHFCHRPDDVAEIFAAVDSLGDKRSHALVRGAADYLKTLNAYSLGKYKMKNRTYNMYDVINITHAHSPVIDAYKTGTLETPDTWETNISTATSQVERDQQWLRLVEEGKLGYLALLRNLRNILNAEGVDRQWITEYLVPALLDAVAIHKSLVFPYQIYSAYKNEGIHNPQVDAVLSDAFYIALDNMPQLKGSTAILLDVSGSMDSYISEKSNITIKEVGAVYAACILLTSEDSDFVKFGNYARMKDNFNKNDNIFDIIHRMEANEGCGFGTDVAPAYQLLHKKYDRIILISDMQVMGHDTYWCDGKTPYRHYCREYGATPIYSFDLGNYHTQTDNPNNPNVHLLTSLSEKTLKFINLLENGEDLISYIDKNFSY